MNCPECCTELKSTNFNKYECTICDNIFFIIKIPMDSKYEVYKK